jgi:hypothetical protein
MAGRHGEVNQGSRSGNSHGVHDLWRRPEESCPEGDRAFVGAKKRGNSRGAKEGRDVAAEEPEFRLRKAGIVPGRAVRARDKVPPESLSNICLPLDESRRTKAALSDNVLIQRFDGRFTRAESVHCLESRMREIRLSGSGGGAASRIAAPTSFSRAKECSTDTGPKLA